MSSDKSEGGFYGCLFVLIFGVLALLGCVRLTGGLMPDYGKGERTGELIKISYKGVIWHSYEGQIVLNQFNIGNNGSNLFEFSAVDPKVGADIEALIGKKVVVTYSEYYYRPISQDTGYTITSIREAK